MFNKGLFDKNIFSKTLFSKTLFSKTLFAKTRLIQRSFAALLLLFIWLPAAMATDSGWLRQADNPYASVRLRAEQISGQQIRLLLDVRLAQGWKTYWRSPGQGGAAPTIRWQSPVQQTRWHWPVPQAFSLAGIASQGYANAVTFPLLVDSDAGHDKAVSNDEAVSNDKAGHAGNIAQPLAGVLTLAVCRDVCLLTDYPFSLRLTTPPDSQFAYDFTRAMGQIPAEQGLTDDVQLSFRQGQLLIRATRQAGWHQPALFIDEVAGADFARPQFRIQGQKLFATVAVRPLAVRAPVDLRGMRLSMVMADNGVAQQISRQVGDQTIDQAIADNSSEMPLWRVLLLALAGGLILNVMPCVLPVLGLKLTSVLAATGLQRRQIRWQFLASAAGICCTFLALALLMSLLRLAGSLPGWGVQFQSPWFIGFMALVMWVFSASLLGLLTIYLPSRLTDWLAKQGGSGLAGNFAQGAFATLLATPCSAPFLGSALAIALAAPWQLLWGIFLAMGVGLSLPWLLVAAFPALVRYLPRPGRWMLWLRIFLGLLLLVSSLWLLSLLVNHIGGLVSSLLAAGAVLLLLAGTALRYGWRRALPATMLGLLALAVIGWWQKSLSSPEIHWQPLTEQAIQQALAEHKRVFVDVTASWCVTCKANDYNVFARQEIQALLNAPDVLALRGDWSRPSAEISEFLRRRASVAVPFNQVYGAGLPQGEVLPVLLTPETVKQALYRAK